MIERTKNHYVSLIDACRYNSLRKPIICFSVMAVCLALMYTGPVLIMGELGLDLYTNQYVMFSS
jgi:hypothetical protein